MTSIHTKEICIAASALFVGLLGTILAIIVGQRNNVMFNKRTISSISPARYSYSQLRKFTNKFSVKLGEGGFGSVYKGIITRSCIEIHVAIIVLKRCQQTKKQFMNKVTTLGSIHHHNLVSLLGYCLEGETHALVYEFTEKRYLDRYIHTTTDGKDGIAAKSKSDEECLTYKTSVKHSLSNSKRNTLLSQRLLQKKKKSCIVTSNLQISCLTTSRPKYMDRSHFCLTQAQSPPEYAAPEMWLKFHGPITEKAGVYGYGMLILEMVGGRKNYDVKAAVTSQVYFLEWLYEKIEEEFPVQIGKMDGDVFIKDAHNKEEIEVEDYEMVKKRMYLVGLWCIQHITSNRPSMDKVVQTLEGNAEIPIPPYPFPENTARVYEYSTFLFELSFLACIK